MSVEIEGVRAKYASVTIRMSTSRGERFFMMVDDDGLSFWSDKGLGGNPIRKSVDDLLDWFGDEGAKKPFRTRKQVKPQKPRTKTVSGLPSFIAQKS